MLIGIVVGNVWATRKEDSLNGLKLMVVQRLDLAHNRLAESFVAVDCVGAVLASACLSPPAARPARLCTIRNPLLMQPLWAFWIRKK